ALQQVRQRVPVEVAADVFVGRLRLRQAGHPLGRVGPAAVVVGLGIARRAVDALRAQRGIEVGARPKHDSVGIRAGGYGAVIGVAKRKGVGKRELERDVVALEVTHRILGLVLGPEAYLALVPGWLTVAERVRGAIPDQRVAGCGVAVVGRDLT